MTLKRATKITGLDIQVVQEGNDFLVYAIDGPKIIAKVSGRSLKIALALLVDSVYANNRFTAMEQSGFRCVKCGKITGLTAHHKIHRARGQRDDRVENLAPECDECHRKEHGG